MTGKEINKWAENLKETKPPSKRGVMLHQALDIMITAAMQRGEIPGWVVSNVLTSLSKKHGYR